MDFLAFIHSVFQDAAQECALQESLPVFFERSRQNGMLPLLFHQISKTGAWSKIPVQLQQALQDEAKQQFILEHRQFVELERVLGILKTASIEALILKGAALSKMTYPRVGLRPRGDVDLFIRAEDLPGFRAVMKQENYQTPNECEGDLIRHQTSFSGVDRWDTEHNFDVHWKISNNLVFAESLGYEEAMNEASPLPELANGALGLSDRHALFLACIHRVAHHGNDERLIWLYDIHLLLNGKGEDWVNMFLQMASEKKMAAVCESALAQSQRWFGTVLPGLSLNPPKPSILKTEPSLHYLKKRRLWLEDIWHELRSLPDWKQRSNLIRQYCFPSAEYMRRKYGLPSDNGLLSLLYLKRFGKGFWRLFQSH